MNQSLKKYLDGISEKSNLIARTLIELIEKKLSQPAIVFFLTEPGKVFLKRIQRKLLEKAAGFDTRETFLNLDFSTSEEVEEIMGYKDEIINFLKNEVGLEILDWYQNMAPMKNSTFIAMKCIE